MNRYNIKLLTANPGEIENYSMIEETSIGYDLTLKEFLIWLDEMTCIFNYSEDYFHFIPIDKGTEMFRKGNKLTKVTKQEFNRALLTITIIQGY